MIATGPTQSLWDVLRPHCMNSFPILLHDIPPYTSVNDLFFTLREDGFVPDNTMILADNVEENVASCHLCQYGELVPTYHFGNYPTHALWICKTEMAFNVLKQSLQRDGLKILNKYKIFELTRVDSTHIKRIKIIPTVEAIENPSEIAKYWKKKCPQNEEVELYENITKQDDAELCNWIDIYMDDQRTNKRKALKVAGEAEEAKKKKTNNGRGIDNNNDINLDNDPESNFEEGFLDFFGEDDKESEDIKEDEEVEAFSGAAVDVARGENENEAAGDGSEDNNEDDREDDDIGSRNADADVDAADSNNDEGNNVNEVGVHQPEGGDEKGEEKQNAATTDKTKEAVAGDKVLVEQAGEEKQNAATAADTDKTKEDTEEAVTTTDKTKLQPRS